MSKVQTATGFSSLGGQGGQAGGGGERAEGVRRAESFVSGTQTLTQVLSLSPDFTPGAAGE